MTQAKIFDTLLEPTFLLNAQKEIIYCNEPAALICDSTVRKLQRQHPALDKIFQFADPIQHLDELPKINDATAYQEVGFTTENGKSGKVQLTIQSFSTEPEQPLWLIYFRDVTLEETLQKKYRAELEQKESYIQDLQKARDELKNYSENLEKMVEERTAEVLRLNQTMRALLDSLAQGFFLFDKDGTCLSVFSKACLQTIESAPAGRPVWDVLGLKEKQVPGFKKWLSTLFSEMLPFNDLAPLGPQKFAHSEGKHIQIEYYPVRDTDNKISSVVVVATDITNLVIAQQEAETERSQSKMLLGFIRHKTESAIFIREARVLVSELQHEINKAEKDPVNLFRILHTLKGGSASFNIKTVADICHGAETALATWRDLPAGPDADGALASLVSICHSVPPAFSEFLEHNKVVLGHAVDSTERWIEIPTSRLLDFSTKHAFSKALEHSYYETFLMVPIQNYFANYAEVIQQVANQESKQVLELKLENGNLEILPEPYENLFSTLIHAYRNAVDHGIEAPELREAAGKVPQGQISTRFEKNGPVLQIEIIDDGGGISPQKIRERLQAKGINTEHETDHQVIQHVFDSQFSTKEVITTTSGRGVGMDAIRDAAQKLRGSVEVYSTPGQGSRLLIKVPYLVEWQHHAKQSAA